MKVLTYSIFIIFIAAQPCAEENSNNTLRLLHILFRHGDRNPIVSPNLYEPNSNFSYTVGEVTEAGKNRSFLLGKFLQNRYGTFLGTYSIDLIKSFTTEIKRTSTTLDFVLKGLFSSRNVSTKWFPTKGQGLWEENSSLPKENRLLIIPQDCSNFSKLYNEHKETEIYQKVLKKYTSFNNILNKNLNMTITSLYDCTFFYDYFSIKEQLGSKLPDWIESLIEQLKPCIVDLLLSFIATKDLKTISIGGFLEYVINSSALKFKTQLQPESRKMFLYSAHDFHLYTALHLLKHTMKNHPPYNSCLMIEAHTINNIDGFKVFYKDGFDNEVLPIPVPGCGYFCPLNKFTDIYKEYLHSYKEC